MTLRAAREWRRWTQEELEERSGVPQPTISKLERGEVVNPGHHTVVKLEVALRLKRGTLIFGQVMERSA